MFSARISVHCLNRSYLKVPLTVYLRFKFSWVSRTVSGRLHRCAPPSVTPCSQESGSFLCLPGSVQTSERSVAKGHVCVCGPFPSILTINSSFFAIVSYFLLVFSGL